MNLTDFIKRALQFFGLVESKLEALGAPADTSKLQAELGQVQNDLATARQTISELTTRAEAAEATVATLTAEVEALPTLVAAKAGEIAAAQGVPPVVEETPAANNATKSTDELWATYNALDANDHKARREFYLANKSRM